MPPRQFEARHGPKRFWSRIAAHEDFFFKLPLMPGARAETLPVLEEHLEMVQSLQSE